MHLHFPHRTHNGKARSVPQSVKTYMVHRFLLLPEYVDMLRCFERQEMIGDKRVRRFSIFSPHKAQEHHLAIRNLSDLMQHRELLEYEGHIEADGTVYVADRRRPFFLDRRSKDNTITPATEPTSRISIN